MKSGRRPAIPGLIVADRAQPMPELPDPLPPGVEVCHDARGDLLAYCRAWNGTLRVDVPDLASFSYERGARHVRAIPHRALPPEVVLETYHHCVLPMILPALGTEVLHASAVLTSHGVLALCGESGTGKSTLALGLSRRGYLAWADDAVALDLSEPVARAVPLPFEMRLRPASASFFGSAAREVASGLREPAPLGAVCVLTRVSEPEARVTVERLPAGSAFAALFAHAYSFSVDLERKQRMIERYLSLIARVQVFEIKFVPGLDRLPAVLDGIERVIDGQPTELPR